MIPEVTELKYSHRIFYDRKRTVFIAVCSVMAILTVSLLTDAKLRPAIYELAALEAKNTAAEKINHAAEAVLSESKSEYADIIGITYGENGAVSGISTDAVALNLLKSRIMQAVNDEFENEPSTVVRVPIGAAAGLPFFEQGPFKKVKIGFSSYVDSDFDSEFESTGINQTRHSVFIRLSVTVVMILPGNKITENIEAEFCVAQAVIVGAVPKSSDSVVNSVNGK